MCRGGEEKSIRMKTYNTKDVKLIMEWVGKYFEANALINNVLNVRNSENIPPFPSLGDEIEYQRLRFWFCNNHDKFIPIWCDFCLSKGSLIEFIDPIKGLDYGENPFLYYYYPHNLLELAYSIGATSTVDDWDLDIQNVELFLNMNNRFSYTVLHLKYWIGEFANTVEGK
jgi:hypothetical protein